MSFTSDYEALRKKRLEDELKKNTSKKSSSAKKTSSNSFTDQYAQLREQRTSKSVDIEDIAPTSAKTWTDTQSFLDRRAEQKAKKSENKKTSSNKKNSERNVSGGKFGTNKNTLTEEEKSVFSEVDSKLRGTSSGLYTSTKMQKLDGSPLGVQNLSLAANDVEKNAQSKYKEADKGFVKKGAFEDGYQFGDLFKSARATEADFLVNAAKGIGGLVEGVTDLAQYGIAGLADLVGADEFADDLKRVTKKNVVNDLLAPVEKKVNKNSFFADTSDAVMQGVGQVGGIILTGGVGGAAGLGAAGTTALTTGTMFASGAGSGMSEAYSDGATDGEAVSYGLISGAADAVTELIFGGLGKGVNALGFSRGLSSADDMLAKALTSKISNTLAKNAVQLGVKMAGEGFEEWLAGSVQAIGKKITYQDEKELSEIINDENLLEQFIVGALTSGIVQAPGAINSTVKGRDFITGLNSNEQKVVDKEIEKRIAEAEKDGEKLSQKDKGKIKGQVQKDLDRGYISIDTIEEVLGGDSYKQYKDTLDEDERLSQQENELREEFDTLNRMKRGEMTGEQLDRQEELRTQLADIKSQLENKDRKAYQSDVKSRLGDEVYGIVKDSRLAESYNERARRGQAFEADVTKYNEKQRDTVQRAIDSGILNDTNKTHDFVDLLAKLSADRGVSFDFTNNERIKESGFAIEGKVVNGFVTEDGISINIDSPKALETTVGHEVTHVLEKSDVYTELQSALFEYAKSKGEYDGRIETLTKLYEGVEGADIYKELTADLVGEYIFNDADFVGNLSTNHRNVFQRIYDEIKHLLKLATAGSKEARQLEKAKHVFDEAWKADAVRKKTNSVDTSSSELKRQSKAKNASALKRASKRYNNKMAQSSETLAESETRIRELRDEIKALDNTINELEASETYTNIFNSDTYANINDAEAAFEQWSEETGYDSLLAERENLKNEIAKMERESVANASGETQYSLGYHAGDLGKAEYYHQQSGDRGTGHFGTGTYFVGDEAKISGNDTYGKRPHHAVEFDNYNLYKIKNDDDGFSLHRQLKVIDGGVSQEFLDAVKQDKFRPSELRKEAYERSKSYEAEDVWDDDLMMFVPGGDYIKAGIQGFTEVAQENGVEIQSYDEWLAAQSDDMPKTGDDDYDFYTYDYYDYLKETIEEADTERNKGYDDFSDAYFRLWLRFGKANVNDALQAVVEYDKKMRPNGEYDYFTAREKKADSRATIFMKYLGYEGIDVRGTKLDNTEYGSVIYDLKGDSVKYSLSDSDGKQLSEGQREYFKDSKVRDDNGALKVMYHGSQTAGFHEFNTRYSDDDRSFFFVDRNDVAATYSGTSETYEARTIRTTEDMNNFLSEIGYEQYEAVERDGKYELLEDGDHVAYSDTAQGLYDEFCWYEGVGEGDVNYKVYLNLTNPLEIDAKGRPWNKIDAEFSQEVYDKYASLNEAEREALMSLAEWEDFRIFNSEIQEARGNELASAYEKMGEDVNIYDLFSVAADGFSEESMRENARRYLNTREYAKRAKEQGYDGVIFKNIVDNGMYSSGSEGASTVAIAFDSAQIKSVANEKPTSDPDIRFSLSEAVEKSGNLIALHNVHESKLVAALKLGGLPSPSVAITKSDIVHDNYGAITMILNKDAIDPQADSRNKVYGSDAWTPTSSNARTEYEVDYDKMRAFEKKIAELGKKTAGGVYASDSLVRRLGIEDVSEQDAVRIAERLANFDEVKAAYLADIGKTIEPEYKKKEYNKHGNAALQKYIDKVGVQHLASVVADSYTGDMKSIRAEEEAVRQIIRDDYAEKRAYALNRRPELKEERINKYMENNVSIFTIEDFVKDAWKFYEEGGAVTEEIDRAATSSKISEAVNTKELIDWLEPQVAEFLGEPGIYNGKDIFTPSGRRRSFSDTHWEYTAENIVKAMQLVSSRGETWGGTNANTLIATATPSYNSIDEMHADEGRLKLEDKEAYDAILDELEENLESVEHDIMRTTKHHSDNTYDEEQIIGSIITEAATGDRTVKAVKRAFSKEGYTISDRQAERILALYNKAADVPTGYFEAKPERVVGFEEVAVVVIPNNANPQLKQELLNKGFSIAEYDPDVEGSRQKVVNSFEQYMFSLSPEGETPSGRGTSGSDVRLESTAVKEELHPIREDVASVQEDGKQTPRLDRKIDMQYLTEEDDIAPPTRIKKPADVYDVDFAPISEEDAAARQREILASITDEDAPPEANTPYSNTRDSVSIDKKTIKQISASVGETLALSKKGRKELENVIQSFSTSENATREGLHNELKERFGTQYDEMIHENIAEAKRYIRTTGINVTPSVKSEFGSPAEYVKFMRSNMGRIRFSKQGRYVDEVYQKLSGLYPELFPADIGNDADEFMRIAEVANEDAKELVPVYLSEADIQDATDMIYGSILEYAETERMASAEENSRRLGDLYSRSNEFTPGGEDIAPPTPREHPELDLADYFGEQISMFPGTQEKNTKADNLERAYVRIDRELKAKRAELAAEFEQRRAELESQGRTSELAELDNEYSRAVAQLDMEAEIERDNARKAHETLRRAELHENIINDMKAEFTKRGSDLDRTLRRAKNLSTFATVDNTPQRVMQKSLGYKEGDILADLTVNKVAQNETEGIKWLNSFTDRKNGELAKISKKYHIKPGSKQSMAAQMYAEGYYVNEEGEYIKYGDHELMADFPNVKVQENIKGLARDPRIRQIYDETLDAINEARVRNGYPEIQRLNNYFLHFQAMGDFFSKNGIPFNPNDIKAKDLPTDINGMTADLKPGQPYFASSQHREGIRTTFDLLGGLEKYLTSAKNQIYHIDDIQKLRALRNYIADDYGQAKGLESIDSMTEEEAQERIKQVFGSHLSTFAKFLNEEANVLAGKTALIDRGLEGIIGRRGITLMKDINKQVGANQVGYNISSPLTNFVADVQAFAKMNKFDFIKGFAQTVTNRLGSVVGKGDNFANESSVIIRRKGADAFHRTTWQKIADPGYALMGITDSISTEIIARAKYNELTRKGMDSAQAHYETDKWVSALMGDRSLGQMPQIFNSATLGLITKYQLEVRNQLDSMVYDTIQEAKLSTKDIENKLARNAKTAAKVVSTWVGLAVSQHIFGQVFKSIAGYNPAFDIIEAISAAFGWDDEEESEDTVLDNIEQGFLALLEDLPYASVITGGGRIPISAALPIKEVVTGKNNYGQEVSRWKTALEALPYYVMPGGYGQFKKTAAGLSMFDDDLPISGSYTDSGALRFPVEETPLNVAQAALFGQYASKNARDYFDRGQKPLEEKQINEFIDSEMPIQDYWDYRAGLSGLKTLEEKADYINSLDIPLWQKNLFINNIADREEEIDMEDYSEYDSMEEFDFANEYPEKYAFFTENGVSYEDYDSASKETKSAYNWAAKDEDRYAFLVENGVSLADPSAFDTEEKKSAWTWAYKNPEKHEVAKAVTGDVVEYRGYTSELYDIRADKDENGDAIVGSAKEKKIDYINGLDLDYGQKIILFKSLYNADDTYNYDIINYLNEREDISYEQMETILKELGFDVSSDGTISWGD